MTDNIEITEDFLRKYVAIADRLICDAVPEQSGHLFSDRHDRKMDRLIRRANHSRCYRTISGIVKYAAIIAAVILTIGFTVTMSVEALRERFFSFIRSEREDGLREWHFFYDAGAEAGNGYLLEPQYIPQGYTLTDYCHELPQWYEIYAGTDGEIIMIDNRQIENGMTMLTNSGYDKESHIMIRGKEATLLTYNGEKAYYILFWFERDMYYRIYATQGISEAEIMKIAENMESCTESEK